MNHKEIMKDFTIPDLAHSVETTSILNRRKRKPLRHRVVCDLTPEEFTSLQFTAARLALLIDPNGDFEPTVADSLRLAIRALKAVTLSNKMLASTGFSPDQEQFWMAISAALSTGLNSPDASSDVAEILAAVEAAGYEPHFDLPHSVEI